MRLEGLIVPLITPLRPDGSVDIDNLKRVVEYVIDGGVDAIFVLGSCGEFPAFRREAKEQIVEAVCRQVDDRVAVLVGIAETSTQRTMSLSRQLTRFDVDAVVATAPFYYAHAQPELVAHFTSIADHADAPVIIYNIPQMVKVTLSVDTVSQLAQHPNVVGIKDSAGDMTIFQQFLSLRAEQPNFAVTQGAEAVAALSLVRGVDGVVLGLANVAPRLCRSLYDAATAGNFERAWNLQQKLMHLYRIQELGTWLSGLKAGVSALGLCEPTMSPPFASLTDEQMRIVRQTLSELELA